MEHSLQDAQTQINRRDDGPVLVLSLRFLRANWLKLSGVSVIVLIPCFWHRRIFAGDLGSHTYNAWLAQLIKHGQVPGLWIARQWNNVLFDFMLSGLGKLVNLRAAEKIAVSLSVLVFFWGLVILVSAAGRRFPWFLLPCIAMFTYGFTFHMGFFNYYLSVGFSFIGLALLWRGKGWERLLAIALLPLILLAHSLGLAWLIGSAAYITVAGSIRPRFQVLLLLSAAAFLFIVRLYLSHHYLERGPTHSIYMYNGADL